MANLALPRTPFSTFPFVFTSFLTFACYPLAQDGNGHRIHANGP
jgi:hypothetical protein